MRYSLYFNFEINGRYLTVVDIRLLFHNMIIFGVLIRTLSIVVEEKTLRQIEDKSGKIIQISSNCFKCSTIPY